MEKNKEGENKFESYCSGVHWNNQKETIKQVIKFY